MIALGAFGCLCGLSMGLAAWRRWRFEQALPLTVISIMLALYIGGLIGLRDAAAWALVAAALAGLAGAVLAVRKKRTVWSSLITPGFAAFALMFAWVWLAQRGRYPIEWDDFSHWALVVKNMVAGVGGSFGNGALSTTFYRDYPPGLALLEWLAGGQPEMTYRVNSLFLIAMALPIFARVPWRRCYWALPLTAVCLALPATMFHTPYTSAYADPALGMLLGYLLYTYWDAPEDGVPWGVLAMASAALTLIKPIGVGLAVLAWLWMAAQKRSWHGGWRWGRMLWPPLAAVAAYASWKLYCRALAVPDMWATGSITPGALVDVLLRRAPAYRYDVIVYFVRAFLRESILGGLLRVSPAVLWLALTGVAALWALGQPERRRDIVRAWALYTAALMVYAGALLLLYLFVFSPTEAVYLASMDRYLGAFFLGGLVWLVSVAVQNVRREQLKRTVWPVLLCALLVAGLADGTALDKGLVDPGAQIRFSREALVPFERAAVTVRLSDAAPARERRVFVVTPGNAGYEYLQALYMFTPVQVNLFDRDWQVPADADAAARWARLLDDGGYTHVYLRNLGEEDAFAVGCAALFDDPADIRTGEVYAIDRQAEQLKLVRLAPPRLSPDPWETGDLLGN